MRWIAVNKGDVRCRQLADRHYTRKSVGHPMWTRPGYNYCLYFEDAKGSAVFCWWRPKWEAGQERKDKLRCLECTIFRNESATLSSLLILEAIAAVQTWERATDVCWPDGLITGVSTNKTSKRRSKWASAGQCFRKAGFIDFPHNVGRADVWLKFTGAMPQAEAPERNS
jgi:hypothetical protein